ncbi:hypothetical protein JIN78_16770 [Roseibacillus ishigakijimensis]|uniref:Uncharacterized protein n=1 Tax=Roseibacillus ishigakijimensis TaxID=454146 RepID=A0A934RRS3_9BACT|nr:hypothetical protein [Roseibacillus ishigakijimensis]MBK1835718.1 hypothetical protein [Roseibacillus ishigakijimensis]
MSMDAMIPRAQEILEANNRQVRPTGIQSAPRSKSAVISASFIVGFDHKRNLRQNRTIGCSRESNLTEGRINIGQLQNTLAYFERDYMVDDLPDQHLFKEKWRA